MTPTDLPDPVVPAAGFDLLDFCRQLALHFFVLHAVVEIGGGNVQRGIVIETSVAIHFDGEVLVRECAIATARFAIGEDAVEDFDGWPVFVGGLRYFVR